MGNTALTWREPHYVLDHFLVISEDCVVQNVPPVLVRDCHCRDDLLRTVCREAGPGPEKGDPSRFTIGSFVDQHLEDLQVTGKRGESQRRLCSRTRRFETHARPTSNLSVLFTAGGVSRGGSRPRCKFTASSLGWWAEQQQCQMFSFHLFLIFF